MSFDGIICFGMASELSSCLTGGKVNQIYQPERDEIILNIRTFDGAYRLLISASASNPRLHLTKGKKENPITAPLFCMILRKHLCGGRILGIKQEGFDRVLKIEIEGYTELGDLTVKTLVVEIMGRHSNVILLDSDNKIIDSIKHIDLTVSAVRQVLPGFFYELPPSQNKLNPLDCSLLKITELLKQMPSDCGADKALLDGFIGMSPLISREILYRFCGETKKMLSRLDLTEYALFVYEFFLKLRKGEFSPTVVLNEEKKPIAFSCVKLSQYEGSRIKEKDSISEAVDDFYLSRGLMEHISQRTAHLARLVNNNIERCKKKIAIHKESIKKAQNRDKYKLFGELLTANIYKTEIGMSKISVENYYASPSEIIEIPLREELSPSQNAQRYYKLYAKAKNAEEHAVKQLKEAEEEAYYLETVSESLLRAESVSDIAEIKEELLNQGYIRAAKKKAKNSKKTAPMRFMSSDGYEILIGRNNCQNDELTIKTAYSTDIWLHTKIIPGSHTIIRTRGEGEVPGRTILEAATLAAYFSKAKNSTQVPVDYTKVKNVKKPSGAKPGLVIYDSYNTVYVTPDENLKETLKAEK